MMLNKRECSFILSIFVFSVLTASSAFATDDLLAVNKTVFIQIILFLIAIYILNTLVFKPFLKLVDRRDKLTRGAIEEARELEEKVKLIIEEYEVKMAEARVQATEERNKIVLEGETVADGIIIKAREGTTVLLKEAKSKLEADTEEIKIKVRSDVDAIAKDIASAVLGKEVVS